MKNYAKYEKELKVDYNVVVHKAETKEVAHLWVKMAYIPDTHSIQMLYVGTNRSKDRWAKDSDAVDRQLHLIKFIKDRSRMHFKQYDIYLSGTKAHTVGTRGDGSQTVLVDARAMA